MVVFNTLSVARSGLVTDLAGFPGPGAPRAACATSPAQTVPSWPRAWPGTPTAPWPALTLTFRAGRRARLGYRTYLAGPGRPAATARRRRLGARARYRHREPDAFRVDRRPGRGGTLTRVRTSGPARELLAGPANELVLQEEYAAPALGRGPVAALPEGPGHAARRRARRRCAPSAARSGPRLVAELTLGELRVTQETLLWDGGERVEFRTHVDGSIGQDRLLRVAFPARGARRPADLPDRHWP